MSDTGETLILPDGDTIIFDHVGKTSDGYHTFDELYEYRKLLQAMWMNDLYDDLLLHVQHKWMSEEALRNWDLHKSYRHADGEECFGGGWFIVMVTLPTGQVSNHYKSEDWDLFRIPERETASKWDGHTPQEAMKRMLDYIKGDWK